MDDDIPDAWTCSDNVWDRAHNSCNIPQALSDEQIDEILMQQARCVCCAAAPGQCRAGGGEGGGGGGGGGMVSFRACPGTMQMAPCQLLHPPAEFCILRSSVQGEMDHDAAEAVAAPLHVNTQCAYCCNPRHCLMSTLNIMRSLVSKCIQSGAFARSSRMSPG